MQNQIPQKISLLGISIFIIGSLFYFYEFILQVSPAVMTTSLMREFSVGAAALGVISASFFYSYTAMQIPAGMLLDKYGARYILTIVCIICALGALLFAFATNIILASFARAMMGFGAAFAFISTLYLIIHWFPPFYFALFAGISQLLSAAGAISGEGPLAVTTNYLGWRHTMIILAISGFVLALITWLVVRNSPQKIDINKKQKNVPIIKNLKQIVFNPQTWPIAIYSVAIWAPIVAFSALWGIPFLRVSLHLSNVAAANAISMSWIGIAIGSPLVGWISDMVHKRCLPLTIVAIVGFFAMISIIYCTHIPIWLLYILLLLVGFGASGQTLIFGVVRDINPQEISSTANGFNNMAVVFGGALFQPLIGKLLDVSWDGTLIHGEHIYNLHAYQQALLTMPACFLVAAIFSSFFIRETHCQTNI